MAAAAAANRESLLSSARRFFKGNPSQIFLGLLNRPAANQETRRERGNPLIMSAPAGHFSRAGGSSNATPCFAACGQGRGEGGETRHGRDGWVYSR